MKQSKQDKFNQQIKLVLDKSVQDIDSDTRNKLQMARAKVLESDNTSSLWLQRKSVWASIASFACVSMFALILFVNSPDYIANDIEVMSNVDSLIFEADAGIELYEQYDFYVWLSEQETNS